MRLGHGGETDDLKAEGRHRGSNETQMEHSRSNRRETGHGRRTRKARYQNKTGHTR